MFSQRYSCDRCRQQKVRCLKNFELSTAIRSGGNHLTPCERCTKADVPCVYSLRQKSRRSKGEDVPLSPRGITNITHDLSSVQSSKDIEGYDFNDLIMPSLDTTTACIDDGGAYNWINHDLTYNREGEDRTHSGPGTSPIIILDESKEPLTGQLIKVSNRALCAIRELEFTVDTTPLTVNSPVVNETFEAANSLVCIIKKIPPVDRTCGPSQVLSSEQQLPPEYSLIFLALATHQQVLTLFRAICDSIKRSMVSILEGTEPQQQNLHVAGSSSAQFIMVLQLIKHLLNRISRSLRMEKRRNSEQDMPSSGREDSVSLQSVVDSAQVMLKTLPDEHVKLSEAIRDLQARIEDGIYT